MDVDSARRVMALQRQIAALRSMLAKGVLLDTEAKLLIAEKEADIKRLRDQGTLDLDGSSVLKPKK